MSPLNTPFEPRLQLGTRYAILIEDPPKQERRRIRGGKLDEDIEPQALNATL